MQAKKSKRANLERSKTVFFQVGLITTLSIIILAFEWKVPMNQSIDIFYAGIHEDDIDIVIPTRQEKKLPELPKPKVIALIEIVEDEIKIDESIEIDVEVDDKTYNEPEFVWEEPDEIEVNDIPFSVVEKMPSFPGGESARKFFLSEHLSYPNAAREAGISGTVYLNFIIERDGKVSNVKVLRGIGGGCDEEAARVVKAMPNWNPGFQLNKAVRVSYNLPIKFKLN